MGIKTTTTYEITVSHKGSKKDLEEIFSALFKRRKSIKLESCKMVKTQSVKTKPVPKISNELKLIRSYINSVCKELKLKWNKSCYSMKNGQYNIRYAWYKGNDSIIVELGSDEERFIAFEFYFPKGEIGKVRVFGPDFDHPYSIEDFDIANPNIDESIKELFTRFDSHDDTSCEACIAMRANVIVPKKVR